MKTPSAIPNHWVILFSSQSQTVPSLAMRFRRYADVRCSLACSNNGKNIKSVSMKERHATRHTELGELNSLELKARDFPSQMETLLIQSFIYWVYSRFGNINFVRLYSTAFMIKVVLCSLCATESSMLLLWVNNIIMCLIKFAIKQGAQ